MTMYRCPRIFARPFGPADLASVSAAARALLASVGLVEFVHIGLVWDGSPLLAVPPVLLALPVLMRGTGWAVPARGAAGLLVLASCLAALASVGLFFVPAAVVGVVAAFLPEA